MKTTINKVFLEEIILIYINQSELKLIFLIIEL